MTSESFSRKVLALATAHAIESAALCLRALSRYIDAQTTRVETESIADQARKETFP